MKTKAHCGFTLIEAIIWVGVIGFISLIIFEITDYILQNKAKTQNTITQAETYADIGNLMNDPDAMLASILPASINQASHNSLLQKCIQPETPSLKECQTNTQVDYSLDVFGSGSAITIPLNGYYPFTLFSPARSKSGSPLDPKPVSFIRDGKPVLYASNGAICTNNANPQACPIWVITLFKPVCPGSTTAARNGPCNKAASILIKNIVRSSVNIQSTSGQPLKTGLLSQLQSTTELPIQWMYSSSEASSENSSISIGTNSDSSQSSAPPNSSSSSTNSAPPNPSSSSTNSISSSSDNGNCESLPSVYCNPANNLLANPSFESNTTVNSTNSWTATNFNFFNTTDNPGTILAAPAGDWVAKSSGGDLLSNTSQNQQFYRLGFRAVRQSSATALADIILDFGGATKTQHISKNQTCWSYQTAVFQNTLPSTQLKISATATGLNSIYLDSVCLEPLSTTIQDLWADAIRVAQAIARGMRYYNTSFRNSGQCTTIQDNGNASPKRYEYCTDLTCTHSWPPDRAYSTVADGYYFHNYCEKLKHYLETCLGNPEPFPIPTSSDACNLFEFDIYSGSYGRCSTYPNVPTNPNDNAWDCAVLIRKPGRSDGVRVNIHDETRIRYCGDSNSSTRTCTNYP